MKREIALRFKRATRTLEAAESLLSQRYLVEAVTRMYYAMFYAATAMHLAEGRRYDRHESLIAEFGKFVVSGRVKKAFHHHLKHAYGLRKSADYDYEGAPISVEGAVDLLRKAHEFVSMAEEFLKGSGGKDE